MIRINLLVQTAQAAISPKEFRRSALAWLTLLPWKRIGVGAAVVVGLYSVWLFTTTQLKARALAKLTQEWQVLQLQRTQLEQTQAALTALKNRAGVVDTIKAPEAQWAPRLNLLSDSLVSQLWFTYLGLEMVDALENQAAASAPLPSARGNMRGRANPLPVLPPAKIPALLLKGSALLKAQGTGAPVSRFLQRLKDHSEFNHWFKEVGLNTVEHRQVNKEGVSDFVMLLYPTGA